jgi:hypothetical protein
MADAGSLGRSRFAVQVLVGSLAVALCLTLGLEVPSRATPSAGAAAPSSAPALLPLKAPDDFVPRVGAKFNHWNISRMQNTIRRHVLRSVNSTPRGATIRWMVFSFGDWAMYRALVNAKRRGVSVQVLGNYKNQETWAPWRKLQATLGTKKKRAGRNPERISWARQCVRSCRGWGGNLHTKLFLFSQVGTATNVTMFGSWNPTWVANKRQWNHMDTRLDPETYQRYLGIFREAKRDRPAGYARWSSGGMAHMVFPRPGTTASTDPVNKDLAGISCLSPPDGNGARRRTVIRIGMYVFGGSRGTWMAKRIRGLWNQGCDVKIIYGFMSARALAILYSRSGRGRIPMRQAVKYEDGKPYRYLHHKFVAVSGMYEGQPDNVVWSGSTNFSNLGFSADDLTVRTHLPAVTRAYFKDFKVTWKGPDVRRPHSGISNPESRVSELSQKLVAPLGQGYYSNLDPD